MIFELEIKNINFCQFHIFNPSDNYVNLPISNFRIYIKTWQINFISLLAAYHERHRTTQIFESKRKARESMHADGHLPKIL